MKRLYVGGLSHTISEKDLRDRFGKFGEVSDVEIITRKDEDGSPLKTFSYININISDSEYKRCMTVLNKSKWKGGTLQIELAKESFLHRLAEERQKAVEEAHKPTSNPQDKLEESFKAAGVENFHMKAAVPGTEIPGHKNWVVSKFGRVLPVLHLKHEGKNKVVKYDPSKHCHNIKKLDTEERVTPVSKLTWEMDGGYDEISKKRRGEFPPQKNRPKKIKADLAINSVQCGTAKVTGDIPGEGKTVRKPVRVLDNDADSEDEIRKLVAQDRSQIHKRASEEEEENLEVVGDDFVVKSDQFWGRENDVSSQFAIISKDDEEYDSADTDEILTRSKTPSKSKELTKDVNKNTVNEGGDEKVKKKARTSPKLDTDTDKSDDGDESSSESLDSDYEAMMGNCYRLDLSLADLESLAKNAEEASDDEESGDLDKAGPSQFSKSSSTSETSPSKKTGYKPEDILAYLFGPDVEREDKKKKAPKPPSSSSSLPAFVGTKDLFGTSAAPSSSSPKRPADELDSGSAEEPKRLKKDSRTSQKNSEDQLSELSLRDVPASVDPQERSRSQSPLSSSSEGSSSNDEMDDKPETTDMNGKTVTTASPQVDCSSNSDEEDDEESIILTANTSNTVAELAHETMNPASDADSSSSCSSSDEDSETSDEEDEEESERTEPVLKGSNVSGSKQTNDEAAGPRPSRPSVRDAVKQQQDNEKRLAAVEERKKEAEQQKKLVQGALSKLDAPNVNKGKHVVFDSDDDLNDDAETSTAQKKSLFTEESDDERSGALEKASFKEREGRKAGGTKLFDGSGDEDEDDDSEDDRFQIKPQFEGKAGQKLMELQSRFGTDPRFQMDARFLDNDKTEEQEVGRKAADDQELDEEKKKNLAILQSVVNVSIQPSGSKESTKGKAFRDMSALHYDPTSEAHAAFEKKMEEKPGKESKAARRKKREEAAKLPEVSKEIYFDVTVDLKEAFGSTKEQPDEAEEIPWDNKEEETAQDEQVLSVLLNTEEDPSSGFKFSFFGDDSTVEETTKTDEYKIETLKGAKVSWHVDPRFRDSSSDEEDVEEEEEDKDQPASASTVTEELAPRKTFFFYEGDIRLIEGPRLFCRRQKLEETRAAWEELRAQLKQDVRKKHRDAVRQQRARAKK